MKRQVKKIFQIKISKSKEQICLVVGIKRATVKINRGTKRKKTNKQLETSVSLYIPIIYIQIRFITFITFLITI